MHTLIISGRAFLDKHTHYEAQTNIGPNSASIILTGDIASELQSRYSHELGKYPALRIKVSFGENQQRIKECRDPYKSANHLIGKIASLDDVIVCLP